MKTFTLSTLCLALFSALAASAQTNVPPASYVRSFVSDIPNEPLVTIAVSGVAGVSCFSIEETIPAPATAVAVSGDGVWLPAINAIRWGPYFSTAATNVSYRLKGLPASYPVSGGAWMDGAWYFSPGPTLVTILETTGPITAPSAPLQLPLPVFTPGSGSNVPVLVSITNAVTNAIIYYTLDGTLPTQSSPASILYTNPVSITAPILIRAVAFASNYLPSSASVAVYGPSAALPNAQVDIGINANASVAPVVTIMAVPGTNAACLAVTETLPPGLSATSISGGGSLYGSAILWGPFFGTNAQVLSYQAVGAPGTYPVQFSWSVDGVGSEQLITNVTIAAEATNSVSTPPTQASPPVFSPGSGSNVPVVVTITDATPNAAIYFTLDGSLPAQGSPNSFLYAEPFPITVASLIRAVAFASNCLPSSASVAVYGPPAAPPDATLTASVNFSNPLAPMVTLGLVPATNASCVAVTATLPAGLGATSISDGGSYVAGDNAIYWGPFFGVNGQSLSFQGTGLPGTYPVQLTLSADGVSSQSIMNVTVASSSSYTVPAAPSQETVPILLPPTASNLPVTVTISSPDPEAAIYYTTDGTVPTKTSALYTSALTFYTQTTLRVAAFRPGYLPSSSAVGEYAALSTNSLSLARTVSGNGTLFPSVAIAATPQGSVNCYTVTEVLPPGVMPTAISADGLWNGATGAIQWGPYFDNHARTFGYALAGGSGTFPLVGGGSFDGHSTTTTGAATATINQSYFVPATFNNLGCTGEPMTFDVVVNPNPGVVTVTSASGTVDWGDGTTPSIFTQPETIFEKQYGEAGTYTVTVSVNNYTGSTASGANPGSPYVQTTTVQVLTNCYPVITNFGPLSQTALVGGTVQFNVGVLSPYPASFQWYFNQTNPVEGPFLETLTLPNIRVQQAGIYSVTVTNLYGSATSGVATLTLIAPLLSNPARNSDGSITLNLTGLPGSSARLWATTNLAEPSLWEPIFTNNNIDASGMWQFTDTNAVNYPDRFYFFSTP